MEIYHYHPITKEYIGEGMAEPSPLEPGAFLIPANATETAPPTTQENEVAVFTSGAWGLQPDFRGQTFYSKTTGLPIEIMNFGISVDNESGADLTDEAPGPNQKWGGDDWVLDAELCMQEVRSKRNELLATTDVLVQRQNEQLLLVEAGLMTAASLTEVQFINLLAYKQALRDLPKTVDPLNPIYPEVPELES